MSNIATVTIPELRDIFPVVLTGSRSPILITGSPGVSKTQFCRNEVPDIYAALLGCDRSELGYIEFNAGQRDPVEVSGIGLPKKGESGRWETEFSKSPLLCLIESTGCSHGVLVVEELTQCGPDMQKVLRPAFDPDTRTTGGDKLPDGWIVVANGNRMADKSGSTRLLSHFANVCLRFEMQFDYESWAAWAVDKGLHPLMIACAGACYEQGLFVDAVPAEDVQYCTPRSFAHAAEDVGRMAALNNGVPRIDNLARKIVEAHIGVGSADMVFNWLAMHDKVPTAKDILQQPMAALLSDETHLQYAASSVALGAATDAESGEAALQYLTRLRPDLMISAASSLLRKSAREGWVLTGPTASQFIAQHADLLPLTVQQ